MTKAMSSAEFDTAIVPALRAVAYLRVSTGRQAESDLSIPDQRMQIAAFCLSKGWRLVNEYVEPGASATDDNRPEFQKPMDRATDGDRPYDAIPTPASCATVFPGHAYPPSGEDRCTAGVDHAGT